MKEFGKYLKEKRNNKKITLRQASEGLKVSISYLSDLENGEKLPPNSKQSEYSDFMDRLISFYELNENERKEIIELADKDLVSSGHVSNDITSYMGDTPMATVALRTAKEKNLSDEEWRKIIENMNK
jgi:transcriptional regulator with XRE-family HTH domain